MKIAHFAIFASHDSGLASGQYETVRDLILAERYVNIDAQFIDYGYNDKKETRIGLRDGSITTIPVEWAFDEADVVFCHSCIPNEIVKKKFTILVLHGRPENSFRLEFYKTSPIISSLLNFSKNKKYQAYLTFWPEFLFYWSRLLPNEKIFYVPPPVDLETYNPNGKRHDFSPNGNPNIVIADMWREDVIPFNLVFGTQYFKENFCKEAKLHIYGLPAKNTCVNFLSPFKRLGLTGELTGLVKNLPEIYRSADMVITPNVIATRIARESLASGTPIVAPHGCQYTQFRAEPRDIKSFAEAMKQCWKYLLSDKNRVRVKMRSMAESEFGFERVGNSVKKLLEGML